MKALGLLRSSCPTTLASGLIIEYMTDAVNCADWLKRQFDPKVRLKAVCRILAAIAAGLAHLHRAIPPVGIHELYSAF